MAYNTKEVKKDRDGNPISQYYNPTTDEYGIVEGSSGANKVILWDKNGNESEQLDLRPILSTLERLTGTVVSEEDRKSNEKSRQSSESDRESAESTRQSQENTRQDDESQRELNESSRESAENIRETNELDRQNEEDIRKSNEATRQSNESDRKLTETSREDAENLRVSAETDRETEEDIRKSNETTRISKESTREENENIRKSNELDRESNESTRQSNESDRKSSEVIRESNESTRIDNMNIVEGWIANPEQFDGRDLEFTWNGTSLGVRLEGDTEYVYVDLKGETGSIENLNEQHVINALGFTPLSEDSLPDNLETTSGSQDKANQAEQNAKNYTDSEVSTHLADNVSKGEIHGFRLSDGKLEYWNGTDYVRVKGDGYPVGNISNFSAKSDDKQITLTWQDPENVTITDSNGNVITIARWKGTKILRKVGSYPQNENDGVLVVDNGIRNQYEENGFSDVGLANEVEYFYMAFPYTQEDVYTVDESNRISATPIEIKIYGVEIDETNSNPETAVIYTDDAVGFTPASGNNGNFTWGSWESIIKDEFMIKPCVLSNPSGSVNYYLQYDDYTKKEDGTNSNLTSTDGDVMVEFGQELWWKFTRTNDKLRIQLSAKQFDGAIKPAFEIENGYNQVPIYPLFLTQILYLLMFKNLDSQTALGIGKESSGYTATGTRNTSTFCYGTTSNSVNVKFLGMEDYWGNKRWWIDGCFYDASRNMLIGKSNFNNTGSGYENFGQASTGDLGGYIDKVQSGNNTGFIPASTGGSNTTYYSDYGDLSAGGLPDFGGFAGNTAGASGGFYLNSSTASTSSSAIGGRLFYSKNGKIYIGVYLGTTQSSKLRSVSGTTPSDTKTIGTFRTEAKANN